jgi:serine/threonine protein kinase
MYVLLSGESPFPVEPDTKAAIVQGRYDFDSEVWQEISEEAKDLIQMMLIVDPQERVSVDDALNHPWFTRFFPNADKPRILRNTALALGFDAMEEAVEFTTEEIKEN